MPMDIERAIQIAVEAHAGAKDKGSVLTFFTPST